MLVWKDYATSIQILSSTFFLHSAFQIHNLHAVYLSYTVMYTVDKQYKNRRHIGLNA